MLDNHNRNIDYLRISVTDRCNLRCTYCMPPEGVGWIPHSAILTVAEMIRLSRLFAEMGFRRIRLTGGEPLVRKGVAQIVRGIKGIPGIEKVTLTTNGVLLAEQLPALLDAGLDGVNISLDTLDRAQFAAIARRDELHRALAGIHAALAVPGFNIKLNCVPSGENDAQLVPIAALAKDHNVAVRFIEMMPIGLGGTQHRRTQAEVLAMLEESFGGAIACQQPDGGGPGEYVTFAGFQGKVGFISAMTHKFCHNCNRVRLSATGFLKTCLQYETGADLKALLNAGASDDTLRAAIAQAIAQKPASHHFSEHRETEGETRNMHQIGG
ncbi:MAG: GTP 3',8-cyclase MoaA [Oscillospiraceae bacterium]|nr:GTP 3',8-cyclase MoaA [Oscillospiraceae bacterium]